MFHPVFELVVFAVLAVSSSSANPIPSPAPVTATGLIVFSPVITYPTSGATWVTESQQTVTWDTSQLPGDQFNKSGSLVLGFTDSDSENLDLGAWLL